MSLAMCSGLMFPKGERHRSSHGETIEMRMDVLNAELQAWYSLRGNVSRLPFLQPQNLKEANSFPELRGNGAKAANTSAILPFCVGSAEESSHCNTIDATEAYAQGCRVIA